MLTITIVVVALIGACRRRGVARGPWRLLYLLSPGPCFCLTRWLLAVRCAEALWVYAALLLNTIAWAVWEVGLDFWSLAPRGDACAARRMVAGGSP